MTRAPNRTTADLSSYPDLVVIYLGMRVNEPRGVRTLVSFGPKIRKSVEAQPDGLLLHENVLFSLFPPHAGMRQYWRDFDSLERWARSLPHQQWWQQFLRDRAAPAFGMRPTSAAATRMSRCVIAWIGPDQGACLTAHAVRARPGLRCCAMSVDG